MRQPRRDMPAFGGLWARGRRAVNRDRGIVHEVRGAAAVHSIPRSLFMEREAQAHRDPVRARGR